MKFFSIALICSFSVLARAGTNCGAPLADRSFCASAYGEEKRISFRGDCSLTYFGRTSLGDTASFDGTWTLEGNLLTIKTGSEVGVRKLIFGADSNSFSAEGYSQEVYSVCQ